jgi:NAD(P)-dependent dehydrogenase (short-subunit alcohol dehydrogenase family)
VAVNYRDKVRRAEQVVKDVDSRGGKGVAVQADITDSASVANLASELRSQFGQINVLILNASGGLEKDVAEDYAMLLNRDSQVGLVKAILPLIAPGGRIVFVTSHLAHFHGKDPVMPEYEPVAASKRAGETALRDLIPELDAADVSFVVVSGDIIEGTITPKLLDRMRPGIIEARRAQVGWLPTTEDFAKAIAAAAVDPKLNSGDTVYVGSIERIESLD